MTYRLKGGNIRFEAFVVPDNPIPPGTPFTVKLIVSNHAALIGEDRDRCGSASTACSAATIDRPGYCVTGVGKVSATGTASESSRCVEMAYFGTFPRSEEISVTLTAPQSEGTYEVLGRLEMRGGQENEVTTYRSKTITVSSDAPVPPDDGDDGDGSTGDSLDWIMQNLDKLILFGLFAVILRSASDLFGGD